MREKNKRSLSVVIPIFDERDALNELNRKLISISESISNNI
jgi:hypothetical protein